jgi:hypothetical protein
MQQSFSPAMLCVCYAHMNHPTLERKRPPWCLNTLYPSLKTHAVHRSQVIVMCATGGTLKTVINRTSGAAGSAANPTGKGRVKVKNYNDPERAFGRESRSLKACYELLQVCRSVRTSGPASSETGACLAALVVSERV